MADGDHACLRADDKLVLGAGLDPVHQLIVGCRAVVVSGADLQDRGVTGGVLRYVHPVLVGVKLGSSISISSIRLAFF